MSILEAIDQKTEFMSYEPVPSKGGDFAADLKLAADRDKAEAIFSERTRQLLRRRNVSEDNIISFSSVLIRVQEEGLRTNQAKDFLSTLSDDELEALRAAHSLAQDIDVTSLNEEGAFNLLRNFDQFADLNNNGLLTIGAANTWSYPPPNAPQAVKDAWREATAGFTDLEKMLKMAPFMAFDVSANIQNDADGKPVGLYGPNDAEYRNIYADENFSFRRQVSTMIDQLDAFKNQMDYGEFRERQEFLNGYLSALESHEVA